MLLDQKIETLNLVYEKSNVVEKYILHSDLDDKTCN